MNFNGAQCLYVFIIAYAFKPTGVGEFRPFKILNLSARADVVP